MRILVVLLLASIGCNSTGNDLPKPIGNDGILTLIKEYKSDALSKDEAVFYLNFNGLKKDDFNATVRYSLNGSEFDNKMNGSKLRVKMYPGTYKMELYINHSYYEVFTDSLKIDPQTVQVYDVELKKRKTPKNVGPVAYKPVIYLYPKEATEAEVTLDIHGENAFYYPEYNDGWRVLAQPDGTLEFEGERFNYLFWEANVRDHLEEIHPQEGVIVAGKEAISFLEEKLTSVGFTSEERADFITFWGPKLAANEHNLVRFEWNESCDKFADLTVSPQPDHLYRFYIFMSAVEGNYSIIPQSLPKFSRDGFVALEWGGQISDYHPKKSL